MKRLSLSPTLPPAATFALTLAARLLATALALLWVALSASPALAATPDYAVQPGDTLAAIAAKYNTSVNAILRVNRLADPNLLTVGQRLKLPEGVISPATSPASARTTTAATAKTSPASAADPSNQAINQPTRVYVVQPGDTLPTIAVKFKTTTARLAELNRRSPAAAINVGEPLRVPDTADAQPIFAAMQGDDIPVPGHYAVHVLQPGESIASVAKSYGTSLRRTLDLNKSLDPANLKAGARIVVPPPSYAELFADTPIGPDDYPLYPLTPTQGKWISVDLDHQRAWAWEGNKLIKSFWISSGKARTPTVTGVFRIWAKIAAQTMTGGSRAAGDYYNLPNVQWVQYFYQDYSFHGTYWHHNWGVPMSHGCVNMSNADAKWLYDWASPTITDRKWHVTDAKDPGTLVIIYQ